MAEAPGSHPPQRGSAIAGGAMAAALAVFALYFAVPAEAPTDLFSVELRRALGLAMLVASAALVVKARTAWHGESPLPEGLVRCPSCRGPVPPEKLKRAWLAPLALIARFGVADTREYCGPCRIGESIGAVLIVLLVLAGQQFINK
jgi:hypothetical protein